MCGLRDEPVRRASKVIRQFKMDWNKMDAFDLSFYLPFWHLSLFQQSRRPSPPAGHRSGHFGHSLTLLLSCKRKKQEKKEMSTENTRIGWKLKLWERWGDIGRKVIRDRKIRDASVPHNKTQSQPPVSFRVGWSLMKRFFPPFAGAKQDGRAKRLLQPPLPLDGNQSSSTHILQNQSFLFDISKQTTRQKPVVVVVVVAMTPATQKSATLMP